MKLKAEPAVALAGAVIAKCVAKTATRMHDQGSGECSPYRKCQISGLRQTCDETTGKTVLIGLSVTLPKNRTIEE